MAAVMAKSIGKGLSVKQALDICGLLPRELNNLFGDLAGIVDRTVHGSRIDLSDAKWSQNGFQAISVKNGDVLLADLTTINMRKIGGIDCYYLLYVSVAPPFRHKNISSILLSRFSEFLKERQAYGFLDDIIPVENPASKIYEQAGWVNLADVIGANYFEQIITSAEDKGTGVAAASYKVFLPDAQSEVVPEVRQALGQSFFQLMSKKAVIDARHNEAWVAENIKGFKGVLKTLLSHFEDEIAKNTATPFMRFLFTRLVTKFTAFRREISKLVGYTGGESLIQIEVPPEIRRLPIQSYTPPELAELESLVEGDMKLLMKLPGDIRRMPARVIEGLPNYYRPSLAIWLEENGKNRNSEFTIGDLLDLGYDPSRLKEIEVEGETYIFERLGHGGLPAFEAKKKALTILKKHEPFYAGNTPIYVNEPRLIITDSDNTYVLRRKISGIHWDEAVDPIERYGEIFAFVVRAIRKTVIEARQGIEGIVGENVNHITFFVPWNFENNQPILSADVNYLGKIWAS